MILIGTDEGIYRWFEGCGWPIFHSLQGRSVVALAAPGLGVLAAVDRSGEVFESADNGLTWRELPLPSGGGEAVGDRLRGDAAGAGRGGQAAELVPPGASARRCRGRGRSRTSSAGFAPRLIHQARRAGRPRHGLARAGADAGRAARRGRPARRVGAADGPARARGRRSPARSGRWRRAPARGSRRSAARGSGRAPTSGGRGRSARGCPPRSTRSGPSPAGPATSGWRPGTAAGSAATAGLTWEDRGAGLEAVRHVRAIEVKPGAPDTLLSAPPRPPPSPRAPRPRARG